MTNRISIITPVLNGERFIEQCLDNVLDQNVAVEHLIVDGESSDRTVAIVQAYQKEHQHIRLISESDRGQSDAMNRGIRLCSGNIISFLNIDDFYEPEVFGRILDIFKDVPEKSFVMSNCNIRGENDEIVEIQKPGSNLKFPNLLKGHYACPHPVNPTSYFYHKSLHSEVGDYDLTNAYNMDLDFIIRMSRVAHIAYFDETWGNFRLIQDCKTYEAIQTGSLYFNDKKVLKKYWPELPWIERLNVQSRYALWRSPNFRHLRQLVKKFYQLGDTASD